MKKKIRGKIFTPSFLVDKKKNPIFTDWFPLKIINVKTIFHIQGF